MATLHHQLQTLTACNTIYVLLPKYLALSDVFGFPQAIGRALPPGKKVILVGEHLSERVVEVLQKLGQHVEILNFED